VHEVVQVADVFAAIFRLNSELADYGLGQKHAGERAHVAERVEQLTPRLLGNAHRWAARSSSDCSAWYSAIAPRSSRPCRPTPPIDDCTCREGSRSRGWAAPGQGRQWRGGAVAGLMGCRVGIRCRSARTYCATSVALVSDR
jgi:hypothetical protein